MMLPRTGNNITRPVTGDCLATPMALHQLAVKFPIR
jgi:hypothetical protein